MTFRFTALAVVTGDGGEQPIEAVDPAAQFVALVALERRQWVVVGALRVDAGEVLEQAAEWAAQLPAVEQEQREAQQQHAGERGGENEAARGEEFAAPVGAVEGERQLSIGFVARCRPVQAQAEVLLVAEQQVAQPGLRRCGHGVLAGRQRGAVAVVNARLADPGMAEQAFHHLQGQGFIAPVGRLDRGGVEHVEELRAVALDRLARLPQVVGDLRGAEQQVEHDGDQQSQAEQPARETFPGVRRHVDVSLFGASCPAKPCGVLGIAQEASKENGQGAK
ncbi:hypothetical protein D3C78_1166610 [compost metagenome]